MAAVAVMPLHDPQGLVLPHLLAAADGWRAAFSHAFIGIDTATRAAWPQASARLEAEPFFRVIPSGGGVGNQLLTLYQSAATMPEGLVLHLCFPDRVAFALGSPHRDRFLVDVRAVAAERTPLLFQRSPSAWASHPATYRELEKMITRAGAMLLGRQLDFAWCHLALTAGQLRAILPHVRAQDFSLLAEMILLVRDQVETQDVDWLAWEDPYILKQDAVALRAEREGSLAETRKRLAYVIPMLQRLEEAAAPGNHG